MGVGSTVRLYLPRAEAVPSGATAKMPPSPKARHECVLVVEDDTDVRTLAVALISDLGYQVLEASDGASAIEALERERHIDLLFTDVILPGGLNGDGIAVLAPRHHPDIKVLYMSGFTQDALVHQGQLEEGVILLHKPFRQADLALKLREALDGAPFADILRTS